MPYGKDMVNILGGGAISAKSFASREWLPVAALRTQNILLMGGRLYAEKIQLARFMKLFVLSKEGRVLCPS